MTVEWHQGHFNAIAKDIRSEFPLDPPLSHAYFPAEHRTLLAQRAILADLAMRFAARFKKYDPTFNVFAWLDQCSPDPEAYPISELWEEDET